MGYVSSCMCALVYPVCACCNVPVSVLCCFVCVFVLVFCCVLLCVVVVVAVVLCVAIPKDDPVLDPTKVFSSLKVNTHAHTHRHMRWDGMLRACAARMGSCATYHGRRSLWCWVCMGCVCERELCLCLFLFHVSMSPCCCRSVFGVSLPVRVRALCVSGYSSSGAVVGCTRGIRNHGE